MGIDGIENLLKEEELKRYSSYEARKDYLRIFTNTRPSEMNQELDHYLYEFAHRVKDQLDYICQKALETGKYGVKVTTNPLDGTMVMEISNEVPFREIHYHTAESHTISMSWLDTL